MTFVGYGMTRDGYANTWRYRDWVINAFNQDMPYDTFVKAQIAADLLPDKHEAQKLLPGLGLFGLGPWNTGDCVVYNESRAEERDAEIDVLSKGFLGLTVTCARCHDHKYDPISQKDYYALGGIFHASSLLGIQSGAGRPGGDSYRPTRLRSPRSKARWANSWKRARSMWPKRRPGRLSRYMMAGRRILLSKPKLDVAAVAAEEKLDPATLQRWVKYLGVKERQHPYLRDWDALMAHGGSDAEAQRLAEQFQKLVICDHRREAGSR